MNSEISCRLIVGGARSGKSSYGETLVASFSSPRIYLATAEVTDDEMARRILLHRKGREGRFDRTIEEPLEIARVLSEADEGVVFLDCLTVFLGNLLYHEGKKDSYRQLDELYHAIEHRKVPLIIISNLLGEGLVPADADSRFYRDMHGWMNQRVASLASDVVRMTCGIPQAIKGSL